MANGGAAGGRFVFGAVRDAADKVIERFEGRAAAELRQEVSRLRNAAFAIDPPVRIDLQMIGLPHDAGDVIVAEVRPADDGPHQVNGCYHIRNGDGIGRMSHLMVMAAARRGRSRGGAAGLPPEVFTKDHFQQHRAVLASVAVLPSYTSLPLVSAWDLAGRERLAELLRSVGSRPEFPVPEGVRFTREPNSLGVVQFDGVAWEVSRFVEGDGPEPRRKLPMPELRYFADRVMRQLAIVLAGLEPSIEVSVRARIWTLLQADGLIELTPEDPADVVDHYEGFRQRQLPGEGLELGDVMTAADLAARDELREILSARFCAQLPLYCHTVRRVSARD